MPIVDNIPTVHQGRGRFVRTPEAEEAVLQYVENNPCCVHTTLREFMYLHQLTIHPECTSLIGILTRTYSKQTLQTVFCSLMKHASHVRESTILSIPMSGPWKTPMPRLCDHINIEFVSKRIVDDFLLGLYILSERPNANIYLKFSKKFCLSYFIRFL